MSSLAYIIWNANPDIFVIPFINHPVRWYGVCWAVALLLSQQIMTYIYKKEGRPPHEMDLMTLYIVVGTIVGARLGHVLFYDPIEYLKRPWEILFIWEGGLASHGGTIGILIAAYLFARKTNVSYRWFLDRLIIVCALCGVLIRFGNLMNSEMIGTPTDLPWAFVFTSYDNIPRHPAQLYESISCFILFVVFFWIWSTKRHQIRNGFLLGSFMILLFSLRFADEFLKVNQVEFEDNLTFNMGQLLSVPFILIGIGILFYSSRNTNNHPERVVDL